MSKRFIETTIWTQNRWFRKLSPKYKLFWIYLICNCDSAGVWEEDYELASFIIGDDFKREDVFAILGDKLKLFANKKIWIVDFCNFQYGTLYEENTTNRPHQAYISLLKKHSLWIDYGKTIKYPIHRDKDKDKEKEGLLREIIDPDLEVIKDIEFLPKYKEIFLTWLKYKRERRESYKTSSSTLLAYKKLLKYSNGKYRDAILIIEEAMSNNYAGFFELKPETTKRNNHAPIFDDGIRYVWDDEKECHINASGDRYIP